MHQAWRLAAGLEIASYEKGLAVTAQDILRAAGTSRRVFYVEVKSVDDLLVRMHEAALRMMSFEEGSWPVPTTWHLLLGMPRDLVRHIVSPSGVDIDYTCHRQPSEGPRPIPPKHVLAAWHGAFVASQGAPPRVKALTFAERFARTGNKGEWVGP